MMSELDIIGADMAIFPVIPHVCFKLPEKEAPKEERKIDITIFYETVYTQKIQQRLGEYYLVVQNVCQDVKIAYTRNNLRQIVIISNMEITKYQFIDRDIIKLTADLMEKEYERAILNKRQL